MTDHQQDSSMTSASERAQFQAQGLYDSSYEKDACGMGFVVNIKGKKSHKIIDDGLEILERLKHRGGAGADENTGDGAVFCFKFHMPSSNGSAMYWALSCLRQASTAWA